MKSRLPALFGLFAVLALAACAGPNVTPTGPIDGPVYYVTEGVVHVIYGDNPVKKQIACETRAPIGSNIERTYCYTAEEVVARHFIDATYSERILTQPYISASGRAR